MIGDFVGAVHKHVKVRHATLEMDATLCGTNKGEALFCYTGFKAYQPLNTSWFELDQVLHTEFRDGNVPAVYDQLRVFKESLDLLPWGG